MLVSQQLIHSDIFDDKVILYPNAIVISMEMNHEIIKTVPSKNGEIEIFRTYYELCSIVNKVKRFLNERGYNAEAGPSLGGEVNYPLLAQKANIGIIVNMECSLHLILDLLYDWRLSIQMLKTYLYHKIMNINGYVHFAIHVIVVSRNAQAKLL